MGQVIVNPQSGLAEMHDDPNAVSELLGQGYHLPLHDADGNAFSAPYEQASELVNSGQYRQPSPEELGSWLEHAHYNSPMQKAGAFIEGAARGVGSFVAPILEEEFLGVPKEEQLKRQAYNPGTAAAGEIGSAAAATVMSSGVFGAARAEMAAPFLPNLIEKAGAAAAKGVELEGSFGNIARAATASAIQGGLYEAQHRITESMLGDPSAVSEHMIADVGLAALLSGAAGGAISAGLAPFSHIAKKVEKIDGLLKTLVPKEAGLVGDSAAPAMDRLGIDPSYQFKSAINIPSSKTWLDRFKGAMPDLGPSDVISFIKNPYGASAYQLGKIAEKLTTQKLVDVFGDQAPRVIPIVEAFKTGLNTVVKIEQKSAGLLGFGAYRATEKPTDLSQIHELEDKALKIEADPRIMIQNMQQHTEPIAQHMPDTAIALTQAVQKAVQMLSIARPNISKKSPLDKDPVPNANQTAQFNNVAHILNNPLSVMDHVKTGTITQEQLGLMKQVYPSLLQNMQKEVMKNLIRFQSESKGPLNYKTKIGLSKLLAQPLDSSLLSIGTNQISLSGAQPQQQGQGMPAKPSKSGMGKMDFSNREKTKAQLSAERIS